MKKHFIFILLLNCLLFNRLLLVAQTWSQVGNGTEASINCFREINGKLIVAGGGHVGFKTKGIASWDGLQWDSIGNGNTQTNGIYAVAEYNNELIIAGGAGKLVTGVSNSYGIAAWDGMQWHGLGNNIIGNIDHSIYALEVYNGELFAGGRFNEIGGTTGYHGIARWNGSAWNLVATGLGGGFTTPIVYSMCVYNNELYIGGDFYQAGGVPAYGIAKWDGTQWDSVGAGVDGYVFDMIVDSLHNNLIFGGNFMNKDTSFGFGICAWNGSQLLPLGKGVLGNGSLRAPQSFCFYKNYLVTALFSPNASSTDTVVAFWDSTKWCPILGPNNTMTNVINFNGELYVGGYFDSINGVPFSYIARYSNPTLGIDEMSEEEILLKAFPNPSTGKINVNYHMPSIYKKSWLKADDSLGKTWYKKQLKNNSGEIELPPGLLPKGIYFISLQSDKGKATVKVVVE